MMECPDMDAAGRSTDGATVAVGRCVARALTVGEGAPPPRRDGGATGRGYIVSVGVHRLGTSPFTAVLTGGNQAIRNVRPSQNARKARRLTRIRPPTSSRMAPTSVADDTATR